jgi:hypothetical protein
MNINRFNHKNYLFDKMKNLIKVLLFSNLNARVSLNRQHCVYCNGGFSLKKLSDETETFRENHQYITCSNYLLILEKIVQYRRHKFKTLSIFQHAHAGLAAKPSGTDENLYHRLRKPKFATFRFCFRMLSSQCKWMCLKRMKMQKKKPIL